jgi:hypothetical protein
LWLAVMTIPAAQRLTTTARLTAHVGTGCVPNTHRTPLPAKTSHTALAKYSERNRVS